MSLENQTYLFEGYEFSSSGISYKTYDDEWCRGIIYSTLEGKFDISINKSCSWARIIINYSDNSVKDLPFNSGTISFLPSAIKVRKI